MWWVVNAKPRLLYTRKRPGTHCIGGWVGPRAGLDGCGKYRPLPGHDPRTVQPIARLYTDWAIPTHIFIRYRYENSSRKLDNCLFASTEAVRPSVGLPLPDERTNGQAIWIIFEGHRSFGFFTKPSLEPKHRNISENKHSIHKSVIIERSD